MHLKPLAHSWVGRSCTLGENLSDLLTAQSSRSASRRENRGVSRVFNCAPKIRDVVILLVIVLTMQGDPIHEIIA